MALPSNVSFGTVVGRFMRAVADTADVGRDPDGVPLSGLTVKFTPSADLFKNTTTTPPVTIVADPITAVTDVDGYLVGSDGAAGVNLLATDDTDLQPTGWTWGVSISGTGFRTITFSVALPAGSTVDLSTVVPVPADPGVTLADWLSAVAQTEAARDETLAALEAAESIAPVLPSGWRLPLLARDSSGAALQAGWLNSLPVFIPQDITVTEFSFEVSTAGATPSSIAVGLYTIPSAIPGSAGSLAFNFGTADTTTTGLKVLTGSWVIPAGVYYLSYLMNGGGASCYRVALDGGGFANALILPGEHLRGRRYLSDSGATVLPVTTGTLSANGAAGASSIPAAQVKLA